MTIEEMKQRKIELGYSNQTLAEKSGVPIGTLQKIFSGATKFPREETIRALEQVLKPRSTYEHIQNSSLMVQESAPAYGAKKLYTLEDYLALPDEQRVELIDGVFYDMAAPTTVHQALTGNIHKCFLDHVLANGGPCYPFVSPVDVQLDADDKTVVQPDVSIVCDRSKYKNGRIFGAPDLIVEVLSPSTKKKDMSVKMYKYFNAGVREYWIIDPEKKAIVQYDIEHQEIPMIYGFEDKVPVLIWDSKCMVDFKEMYQHMAFLWE